MLGSGQDLETGCFEIKRIFLHHPVWYLLRIPPTNSTAPGWSYSPWGKYGSLKEVIKYFTKFTA
jgi:hypothetical protein